VALPFSGQGYAREGEHAGHCHQAWLGGIAKYDSGGHSILSLLGANVTDKIFNCYKNTA
jgi:hypothetical protein